MITHETKTIFPNLKLSIKYSDVIQLYINQPDQPFKLISILIDKIKRGKTAKYEAWIRNKFNNKAGNIII
ncbi:MAG: hypothetical protein KDD45_06105 [Bdellovibrionales bacterium]|nr:hypothetical protein [Bdellovibrionales bacterium]